MSEQTVGMDWIAAFLAPWTISPHPNFSSETLSAQQALALTTERRSDRNGRGDREPRSDWPAWARSLVDNAQLSLEVDTQASATQALWEIADANEIPAGARIASASFASLGSLELEHASESVDNLLRLFADLVGIGDPERHSASYRLAVAVLAQQLAARAPDACRDNDVRFGIQQVFRWLPRAKATDFEVFSVSKGISWGSSRVQRDIAASTKMNAFASRAISEQSRGDTWVRVVRGRSSWIDMRHYVLERNRNGSVLRDDFERKFESTSGKRVFMRDSTIDNAYAALLAAELSGDVGRMRSSRAEMAKIHLLRADDVVFRSREALRLLRHSRATAPLKSALAWIRAEGPLVQLRDDALSIVERSQRDGFTTETDLLVLEASADVLSAPELVQAMGAAFTFSDSQSTEKYATWFNLEKTWRAVGSLAPGSDSDNDLASRLLNLVTHPAALQRPLSTTLARVVSRLQWTSVSPQIREQWKDWLADLGEVSEEFEAFVFQLEKALGLPDRSSVRSSVRASGLELAAVLADEGLSAKAGTDTLQKARNAIIEALETQTKHAAAGSFSFGGMAPSNVAVAFALRFKDARIWDALVENIANENVSAEQKSLALDRLAHQVQQVPKRIQQQLGSRWRQIADSPRNSWGDEYAPDIFPEALRMASAFGSIGLTDAIEAVLHLSGGGDMSKVEACHSVPYIEPNGDATWAHTLLLQLSNDDNPNVRAEAGFAMVRVMARNSHLTAMVRARIAQLMTSDGIRSALRVLHGLQAEAQLDPLGVAHWRNEARELKSGLKPRIVREAASEFLRLSTGT